MKRLSDWILYAPLSNNVFMAFLLFCIHIFVVIISFPILIVWAFLPERTPPDDDVFWTIERIRRTPPKAPSVHNWIKEGF